MSPVEGKNRGKAPIKAPLQKTMENRSPVVWAGKTMLDPTVDATADAPAVIVRRDHHRIIVHRTPVCAHLIILIIVALCC